MMFFMLRLLKRLSVIGLLAAGCQVGFAFSLHGPFPFNAADNYQVGLIGYNLGGDNGAPKNIGEEYRWNTPILYYTFDQNFLDYFGSNGVYAVEEAIAMFNGLTNVSSYSPALDAENEFPLEAIRANYLAEALSLTDLKSMALSLLAEQLGLSPPDRYTWTLRTREVGPGGCPNDVTYLVIQRNFDPVASGLDFPQTSSYVNGVLYSYVIQEFCNPPNPVAEAVEFSVDPLARWFKPVASGTFLDGEFFTGLTRDDVGGLRYLYRAANRNVESGPPGSLAIATNYNVTQLLFTSNLTLLVNQALTNSAAALSALYPDLVIGSTTPIYTNLVSTNVFFYFTNHPWAPAGTYSLVFQTNRTTNVVTWFSHTFDNVVTNTYYTNGFITILETNIAPCPLAPAGSICTNVTKRTIFTNFVNGDYYILPTNSACGVSIINTQLTSVLTLTNSSVFATNSVGQTNVNGQQFSQTLLFYFTNRVFVVHPVPCLTNTVAQRGGIEKITFVRRDFDSLIGQFFYPITNFYNYTILTNNALTTQVVRRVVTQPDVLISATDLTQGPPGTGADTIPFPAARTIRFNSANALNNLAGPGTIEPNVVFEFNKVGPQYANFSPDFMDEVSQIPVLIWGSFHGDTNAPVVYPNGTSITNLENQVLIQVLPASLPAGEVGEPYSALLTVTGGLPPYVWTLTPGEPALPNGLTLSPGGLISGTPTEVGVYDFSIRLTESGSRFVDRPYSITVSP